MAKKKKAPRASSAGMGMNPWLQFPVLPEDTFGLIGEDQSLVQTPNYGQSDTFGQYEQSQNDQFLNSLSAANAQTEPTPQPPAPVVGSEVPAAATVQVPPPDFVADPQGYREAVQASDPYVPGKELYMEPANFAAKLAEPPAARTSPYEKHQTMNRDTRQNNFKGTRDSFMDPEKYAQILGMVQGKRYAPLLDAAGVPQYTQEFVRNPDGSIAMVDGQPVTRQGEALYDQDNYTVDPEAPYQQSLQAINQQRNDLQNLLENTNPQLDLSPLMGFAGLLSGHPELQKNYRIPPKFQETLEKVIQSRKGIADQQNKLFSDTTAAAKALKDGSDQSLASQILMRQQLDEQGTKPGGFQDKLDLQDARQTAQNHRFVLSAIKNNPAQARLLGSYRTLGNALGILNHSGPILPAQIEEFQQQLRTAMGSALTGGGRSGVAERERSYAQALDWSIEKLRSFLTGKPGDIMQDQETLNHLQVVAGREQQQLRALYKAGLQDLASGFDWIYDREDPNYDEAKYGRYADAMERKMELANALMGPIGSTPVEGGAGEIARQITAPSKKIATQRRREERLEDARVKGPTKRQKEIKRLKKELGM